MIHSFDKSRCSFHVPKFQTYEEEIAWIHSLTDKQRSEFFHWMKVARWGEAVANRPMDKSYFRAMTQAEFNAMKEEEDREEAKWRKEHGWPHRPWDEKY
jgi:hypothetical protein